MNNKIGVLCTYPFPEGMAPTIRILSYGRGLVQHGYEVEVVVFQPKVEDDNYPLTGEIGGVKYFYSHKRNPQKSKLYKLLIDRPMALINAVKILCNSNKCKAYDCILLSFDYPLYLIFFAPILKFLRFNIGFIGDEFPEPIRRLRDKLSLNYILVYKFVYIFISFRILMTEALKDFYDNLICQKPTYILCSILNTDRFYNIRRNDVERKYLCYMGNLMLAKDNVDNIVRAFAVIKNDFPDIDLYLYGTPNDKDRSIIEDLVFELKLNNRVFVKGRIEYGLVPQVLANAEVLVTSQPITKRAAGGFPTKLAEYMMSHTPAIVTDVGEIHNYVHDGDTVFMVEPCNEFAYAEKLKYILTHPEVASLVANRAYNYAIDNFGSKDVTQRLIQFIRKL